MKRYEVLGFRPREVNKTQEELERWLNQKAALGNVLISAQLVNPHTNDFICVFEV